MTTADWSGICNATPPTWPGRIAAGWPRGIPMMVKRKSMTSQSSARMLVGVTAMVAALANGTAWPATTSPGKNAAHVSAAMNFPAAYAPLVSVDIALAKPKRVLVADATMIANTSAPVVMIFFAAVTDGTTTVTMEPSASVNASAVRAGECALARSSGCSSHGVFWLDLDANPSFIGKKVTVRLIGGADFATGIGTPATIGMTVRMEKK